MSAFSSSPDVAVVVPAAGAGTRLGGGTPKALRPLAGQPLLWHAVWRLLQAPSVGSVVVAAPTGMEPLVADLLHRVRQVGPHRGSHEPASVAVVTGGPERQQSVARALSQASDRFDIVLVHDAARALTPAEVVEDVARAVRTGHDAVIPVLPVVDTITRVNGDVSVGHLDRAALRAVQTPQGFRRRVLVEAHDAAAGVTATDDAGLVARLGVPVHTVPGSARALKITTPADLAYAETLLAAEQS